MDAVNNEENSMYSYSIDRTPTTIVIPTIDSDLLVSSTNISNPLNTNNNVESITNVSNTENTNNHNNVEPTTIVSNTENTNEIMKEKKENDFSKIIKMIKNKIKNNCREYHFRPFRIDGVYCYIVLYLKERLLTIESINVKCDFTDNHILPYVLYHKKYKSVEKIVKLIYEITKNYKIVNGDLLSPKNYDDVKVEEELIPYNEDEVCCVCLENTTDNTSCGHFICFRFRDKCIIQKKKDCPLCRCKNVLTMYNNSITLINNIDYSELNILFMDRIYKRRNVLHDEDDNSIVSSSSSESESESESEEEEEEEGQEAEAERRIDIIQNMREVGLYSDSDSDSDAE